MISSRICFFFTPTHWMHYCFWRIWHWPCYIIGQDCLISPTVSTHRKEHDNCHSALSVPSLQITWFLLCFLGPRSITLSFPWPGLISVTTVFHFTLRHIQHQANISIPSFSLLPITFKMPLDSALCRAPRFLLDLLRPQWSIHTSPFLKVWLPAMSSCHKRDKTPLFLFQLHEQTQER